ncbi:MAG: hypothetical protein PHR28_03975 [candidate division Zixibacteria bacterium]|nr:hypothetical protein [candidate division Zixibacteria bacterium]
MTRIDEFIGGNGRISIISGGGDPTPVPRPWRPLLDSCDLLVAIPDMHMYHYGSQLDGFRCGAEAMLHFLQHLDSVRRSHPDRRLRIIQMGDLYELWFSHPRTGHAMTPEDIWKSHPLYEEIHRLFCLLRVERICGNHDYRYVTNNDVRLSVRDGKVHLEHGFAADHWYHFSNPHRPLWPAAMAGLKTLRRIESGIRGRPAEANDRQLLRSSAWGTGSGDVELETFTKREEYRRRSLLHYSRLFQNNREVSQPIRLVLVGHTHKPYLDLDFAGESTFYMDAGAWSYGRSDFAVVTNEEVAVCHYTRLVQKPAKILYRQAV